MLLLAWVDTVWFPEMESSTLYSTSLEVRMQQITALGGWLDKQWLEKKHLIFMIRLQVQLIL